MNLTKYRHIAFVLAAGGLLTLVLILLVAQPGRAAGPWYVAPDGDDGNDCLSPGAPCATINGVIGKASPGDTIYVAVGTYTGTGDEVVLLDKDVTLSGGWGSSFTTQSGTSTIDGEDARRGISVNSGVTAIAERFTVQNGSASSGGGIRNEGTLVLNNSTVSGNTTSGSYCGGGIINYYGTLTLNDSTVSDNTASYDSRPQRGGGGINNYHGTLTLNNSTISGNSVTWTSYPLSGGGIYNLSSGTLTLSNSTISGNTAWQGSGIYSSGGGNVTLNNSTVSGNMGDGIQLNVGTLALGNSTVSRNSGHGISTSSNGTVTLHNSVLAENASGDCSGTIGSEGYNLLGDISDCAFTPSTGDLIDMDANLGPLIGSPAYHPLPQDSPAIDAVPLDQCTLDADQRGVARPQGPACDMGAYEYTSPGPAASVLAFDGTPQRTPPLSTFVAPFRALVLDSIGSPVSGETVTFSAPASGASGTFADSDTATTTAVTDESGVATAAMFTANGLAGSYVVTAEVSGIVTSANFLLTNVGWYASPTGDDANDCQAPATPCATIDGPLAKPGFVSGDTVLVATGTYTGTGDEVVLVDQDVRLSGGWDAVFTVQSGVSSTIDGEWARRGVTVNGGVIAVIERFTVHHGATGGGGIHNNGTLTLNDCAVSGNIDGGIRT